MRYFTLRPKKHRVTPVGDFTTEHAALTHGAGQPGWLYTEDNLRDLQASITEALKLATPAGPRCSSCGYNTFCISVTQDVIVKFNGEDHEVTDGPQGDMEWADDSLVVCTNCGHQGELRSMTGNAQ